MTSTDNNNNVVDVVIVGGGVVGCAVAQQIRQRLPTLSVALVEAGPGPKLSSSSSSTTTTTTTKPTLPHPRSYALSPASLELLGLWKEDNDVLVDKSSSLSHRRTQERLGFYDSMQIWEANQPASLIFDAHTDLDHTAVHSSFRSSPQPAYLGAVVEDAVLQQHLWQQLVDEDNDDKTNRFRDTNRRCQIFTHTKVGNVTFPASAQSGLVHVELQQQHQDHNDKNNVETSTQTLHGRLLVAADGANSHIRKLAGIPFLTLSDYAGSRALTFTVQLATPHGGRAFQRFGPHGILALLPTFSSHHAIVVWSTTAETVQYWNNGTPDDQTNDQSRDDALVDHLNELLQQGPQQLDSLFGSSSSSILSLPQPLQNLAYGLDKLVETVQYGTAMIAQEGVIGAAMTGGGGGPMTVPTVSSSPSFAAPPLIAKQSNHRHQRTSAICSPKFSFPLSCRYAQSYTRPRLALCGDAAHTMHPLAGQGLNLGLQDVQALLHTMERAVQAGMDPAMFLSTDYEPSRQMQVRVTLAGIHSMEQIFTQPAFTSTAAKHVKSLGMSLIQTMGPVRRQLVQAACQGVVVPNTTTTTPTPAAIVSHPTPV